MVNERRAIGNASITSTRWMSYNNMVYITDEIGIGMKSGLILKVLPECSALTIQTFF